MRRLRQLAAVAGITAASVIPTTGTASAMPFYCHLYKTSFRTQVVCDGGDGVVRARQLCVKNGVTIQQYGWWAFRGQMSAIQCLNSDYSLGYAYYQTYEVKPSIWGA